MFKDAEIEKNKGEVIRERELQVIEQQEELQAHLVNLNIGPQEPVSNYPTSNYYANSYPGPWLLHLARLLLLLLLLFLPPGADKLVVHVDLAIGKANGPHKKLRTYLAIVARDKKLVVEKTKKKLEEAAQSESTEVVIDPPSPIKRHVKWKMACTKKTGQMMSEAAKEIAEKIDLLTVAIGRPEHPGRMHAAGAAGLALPPEPEVGPSAARVNIKGCCVDPSATDLDTSDADKCGLYIKENPSCPVALGRVYEGSTVVHNIPLLHGQVKVGVQEVKDANALVPVPTDEVAVSPAKPADRPDPEVMWDAFLFGLFNSDFPLYIKHEDLSEIAHGGQCLSISVIQLWIFMRARNSNMYGFLEPQSIQRSGQLQFESESYMKSWMQNSKRDVYLGAYLNGAYWQMVVILPKENVVVWFCSLHNKLYNYLKGIINRPTLFFNTFALALLNNINILMFLVFNNALKGLDDTPQPKSKVGARWIVVKSNRQKGNTECGYYMMHWKSTIILGSFRNNWKTYFNDVRPLEVERLKALRIQWAQYYLKVRNKT
ncbi:hypothetical protein HKD37_11G031990 [Glycine soja]